MCICWDCRYTAASPQRDICTWLDQMALPWEGTYKPQYKGCTFRYFLVFFLPWNRTYNARSHKKKYPGQLHISRRKQYQHDPRGNAHGETGGSIFSQYIDPAWRIQIFYRRHFWFFWRKCIKICKKHRYPSRNCLGKTGKWRPYFLEYG